MKRILFFFLVISLTFTVGLKKDEEQTCRKWCQPFLEYTHKKALNKGTIQERYRIIRHMKYVKKRSDEEIIDMANVTKQDIAEVMRIVDRKTGKFPWELQGQQ
ncbi:hypothetical protein ACIQXV_29390 [Neobacillus sp. NPDC097160]|uniref:hypothetical protein n=1 Tax=Neobacillus sp. NPDC097160 TaxID=3364298 RepID=UPI0038125BC5